MFPPGQLLFARKIPLFSKLADNSTFTPFEETSIGLYRFNWSEVGAGHFLSDLALFVLGFLLLTLAIGYGKHYLRRDLTSVLLRAGRVWGALWCAIAAVCFIIGAIDLSRLPIDRAIAAFWTVILVIVGLGLFALTIKSLRRAAPDNPGRRTSDRVIKVSGFIIAAACASLLHVVDFPPQTSLGWVVVQLLILGVPAGIGFLLPSREAVESPGYEPERELTGARYFRTLDFVLFIPFVLLMLYGLNALPRLGQNNIIPIIQALLLSICLFNRVPEREIAEHPKSLFGNVFSAMILLQFAAIGAYAIFTTSNENVPFAFSLIIYMNLTIAAIVVCLVLSLRVLQKGEVLKRPWWRKARYWIIAALATSVFLEIDIGPAITSSPGGGMAIPVILTALVIALVMVSIAFFTRRRHLRRPIRFVLIGILLLVGVLFFAYSRSPEHRRSVSWIMQSMVPQYGTVATLVLLLLVLTFKKPAEGVARALRGRPARVAFYSLVIALAFLCRGLENFPSCPLGSLYYSSLGLTEDDGHALNILPLESLAASRFLEQSTFDDLKGAQEDAIYVWAGVFATPVNFRKTLSYTPELMGAASQLVVGAARVIGASNPSDVQLDVLYSRRVIGTGLADHLRLQLTPNRIRKKAARILSQLKQAEAWRGYFDYPRAAIQTFGSCRQSNSMIEAIVGVAVFALSDPPGHEALRQFWRMDGMPGVTIY
ncbi:hypothetical protein J7M28_07450 [bacterium]|nr:hypothetical protein [bacterium]